MVVTPTAPLFVVCFLTAASVAAPAWALEPEEDEGDADAIAQILAAEQLVPEANAPDGGSWDLVDVLRKGFAQTPSLDERLADVFDPLAMARNQHWHDTIEAHALAARLRGAPAHQAREVARRIAFDIPLADHPLVDAYIDYFTGRGRWFFARWLERADRYMPIMQPILAERGLPQDLIYLAMIESGMSSRAYSSAAAAGFWQFIPSTGRAFKLRQDTWSDERRDFILATRAAASYLGALYKEFGDWHLAWASYNAGEGRIRRAIAKYGKRDFWYIIDQPKSLAQETRHYVPKIIAAAIVAKDRVKYGFTDLQPLGPLSYDELEVEDATDLAAVARQFGFTLEELRDLNPTYLYGVTPPGRRSTLRVPGGRGGEVAQWLAGLPRRERLTFSQHRVQRGDTLSRIAHLHGTSIAAVRDFNKVGKLLRVGQVLVIPAIRKERVVVGHDRDVRQSRPKPERTTLASAAAPPPEGKTLARHRVAVGETLWSIAQRYNVSVDELKSWNGRRSNKLGVGEVLRVYQVSGPET